MSSESGETPEAKPAPSAFFAATLTLLAMVAFAANSILTRMALGPPLIDAATFTAVRLLAGAVVLVILARLQSRSWDWLTEHRWSGPIALFAYAAPFSFAYLRIGAAAGALVLFAVVQLTMVGWSIGHGERPRLRAWIGLALAMAGLVALTLPSVSRPDPLGVALMAVAGVAWGAYSLAGRGAPRPLAANAFSFLWSLPFAAALVALLGEPVGSSTGLLLAVVSGAITSGLGYAIWYQALRNLTAIRAAVVQLSVPIIAGLGATTILGEPLTFTLLFSGVCVLGGIALVISERARRSDRS